MHAALKYIWKLYLVTLFISWEFVLTRHQVQEIDESKIKMKCRQNWIFIRRLASKV